MAVCNLACEGLSGASASPDVAQRKLYIGGLSPDVTSEMLLSFFERHGEIEEGSVAYDKDSNESRYNVIYHLYFAETNFSFFLFCCKPLLIVIVIFLSVQWVWLCYIQDIGGCKESNR